MSSTPNEPPYLKVYLPQLETRAVNTTTATHYRLHLLALARAEPNRHAEFKPGALAMLMGKNGRAHHDIKAAIAKAVACDLLDAASMSTCLVLPEGFAQPFDKTGRGKHVKCKTHTGNSDPLVTAWNCAHTIRKHKAHGLCDGCYRTEKRHADRDGRPPWWDTSPIDYSPSAPEESGRSGEIEGELAG